MNKQQIINLGVAKLSEIAVGVSITEIIRIITKVADLVEDETKKEIEEGMRMKKLEGGK